MEIEVVKTTFIYGHSKKYASLLDKYYNLNDGESLKVQIERRNQEISIRQLFQRRGVKVIRKTTEGKIYLFIAK